jgi:hypothetical protein
MVTLKMKMRKPKGWYLNQQNTVSPRILFKQSIWSKDTEDGDEVTTFKLRCNSTERDSQFLLNWDGRTIHSLGTRSGQSNEGSECTMAHRQVQTARRVLDADALAVFEKEAIP